jgi:hypothetical protein
MKPPFSAGQFLDNMSLYNESIWPAQFVAAFLCLALAALPFSRRGLSLGLALAVLSGLWIWNGLVFQAGFHSRINPLGLAFAVGFVAQGVIFAALAFSKREAVHRGLPPVLPSALLLYALLGYPLLGLASGRFYPEIPVLGVAPCPTTIFSLGIMLVFAARLPWWTFVIPVLWTAVGTGAIQFGIYEDLGLPIAGVVTLLTGLKLHSRPPAKMAGST